MRILALSVLLCLFGCPKKPPPDDTDASDLPPPSVKLQVAGIDPAFAPADHSLDAEIFGSGFEDGARVAFSGAAADSTRFVDDNSLKVMVPAMPAGEYDVTVINPDGTKATLRKGLTLSTQGPSAYLACASVVVRFDYDASVLNAETRRVLDSLASCLRDSPGEMRVEGHCDERGTTDYNLALGQRRAEAVQRYLVGLGVSPARMRAISYGEESPVDRAGSQAAFATNRRVEIQVRE